ncbi:50S ribosomal protein L2 [Methanoculleus sp. FWC-SCC1]|uniref:Large ribosomal subunit protein uL2 n=1 Tax=Methanoculleus frigidifontis TaxID=2584085 RepID=A0ABT8MC27_9EURY|nr:50S ribosomal protein L2 [Methanoculleus sp. FWC-SCC1]MDN7025494.1 50S ribosomal protein L2 [Methanoculleus sp. FWC-SCC1]
MAHRIIAQNRGRGGPTYRAPSHRYKAALRHIGNNRTTLTGRVVDIEHDPARHTPIALVQIENGSKEYMLVTEGVGVGDAVAWGPDAEVKNGNTLPLKGIPVGAYVCNIEARPNDGGKFVRSGGVQALIIGKSEDGRVGVRMPSGKNKWFNGACMATVGIVAGGGRGEKPFVKAGKKHYHVKSSAEKWPRVKGVCMNVIDHPFGGGGHQHCGRPKTVARGTSPGRKVGHIAARRTGKWKK